MTSVTVRCEKQTPLSLVEAIWERIFCTVSKSTPLSPGRLRQPSVGGQDWIAPPNTNPRRLACLRPGSPGSSDAPGVLIQRHHLAICGKGAATTVQHAPRKPQRCCPAVLVVVPLKPRISALAMAPAVGNVFRQERAEVLGRRAIVAPDKRATRISVVTRFSAARATCSAFRLGQAGVHLAFCASTG